MRLISLKTQKYLLFIPYLGLFTVATIQTINLSRIKDFRKAWLILFKTLCPVYFIVSFIYSYFIHPLIYNKDNLVMTYIYVITVTYILHIIMGFVLLYNQSKLIKNHLS